MLLGDDDSVFGLPALLPKHTCDSSSSDDSYSTDYHTASDGSPDYLSALNEDTSVTSALSSDWSYSSLGPPPPGSIMTFWDKPIPSGCLHDFPFQYDDSKFTFLDDVSLDSDSDAHTSDEYMDSDEDTYAE